MADANCFETDFQPHRRAVLEYMFGESSTYSYLMGNTKPIFIDMTLCQISPARCLFLGSGDIRNILYLIHTSPTVTEWEFDLVDNNSAVVARNLLFLHMMNDETVSVDLLWSIWYDFILNKNVYSYLQNVIEKVSINNLDLIHETSRLAIAKVFEKWLLLFQPITKEKACQQRYNHLLYCFESCQMTCEKFIDSICESIASILINENSTMIDEAQKEVKQYIERGTTQIEDRQDYVNITMLQPFSGLYAGHYGMCPYQGYIPFETIEEQEEFRQVTAEHLNPLITYCKYKLEQWVKTYRQYRQKIKWHFWYGDALSSALFHMPLIEFDLIHTSNLCDHIGMLNLLVTCINLLRNRPWARILTQSMMWRKKFPRFIDYFSQLFNGIELSWFPSLFGLICECTRTIGIVQNKNNVAIKYKSDLLDAYEYQVWRLTTNLHLEPHLRFDDTDVNILEILDKIAERCFYTHITKPKAYEGIGHSTTLTYYLLLRQYCLRCRMNPNEAFEYLFQRTCERYRAYATGLRVLRDFFTNNDDVYIYTSKQHSSPGLKTVLPCQIKIPVLQILIIECDEQMTDTLLNNMRMETFKEITKTSVMGSKISYDLRTGIIKYLTDSDKQIKFHLIDDFIFKSTRVAAREQKLLPDFYINLGDNADVQFILPISFSPLFSTALLIDTQTWFPFGKFRLSNPITVRSKSGSKALAIRDAVSLCYADISDRKAYYSNINNQTYNIRVLSAYETSTSFHILIKIGSSSSTWTHTQHLTSSDYVLVLNINFSQSDACLLRLAFACPLDLNQSKFQLYRKDGKLNMILAKNTAELLSLITFTRESTTTLFDSTTAKRWSPPRLANGRLLDIQVNFPGPTAVGGYDAETKVIFNALMNMFTASEYQLSQRNSGDHLYRDADFDLRESIKQMYLQAFCGRQRFSYYTTKAGKPHSTNDIRSYGDILFLYEGVYNYCDRPILAVSYLDMIEITDNDVNYLTQYIKNLLATELNIYMSIIAQARSLPHSSPPDCNVLDIIASKEELDLMRKFLIQNSVKTKNNHRNNLYGPWHASFVEILRSDARSQLLSTKLTRDSGIDLVDEARKFLQRQMCRKTTT